MKIKEEINNSLLDLSRWWGLRTAGFEGIAIKQDGSIIKYNSISKVEDGKLIPNETVKEICVLSVEELENIKKVLIQDEKVFETTYQQPMIFDMGTTIKVNIDGNEITIKNESKMYNESQDKLYDRLLSLVNKLVSNN